MNKKFWSALVLMSGVAAVSAQTIAGLSVSPNAQVGQSVTATVKFNDADSPNCGLRFYWGDGQTQDIKVTDAKQNPLVLSHTYAKAGKYDLMAEGKKVTSHFKCGGANARASVTVAGGAAAAAGAATAASAAKTATKPASPQCPEGWKLDAKSVNKKTGAYTCSAKAGTALPEKKLACTGDTGYFENAKKGQVGCRI
jgi:hypothetical protein